MHSTSSVGTGFEVSDCSRIVINKLNAKLNNYTDLFSRSTVYKRFRRCHRRLATRLLCSAIDYSPPTTGNDVIYHVIVI